MSNLLICNNTSLPIAYVLSLSACQLFNYNWSLTYKDVSNISGSQVYLDIVGLGPNKIFAFPNQSVLVADMVTPVLLQNQPNFDGIVGLIYSDTSGISPNPQQSFFKNIAEFLDNHIIGMALKHDQRSSLDFGYANQNFYNGTLAYQDINTANSRWQVHASNSLASFFNLTSEWDTYIDSSSAVITVPADVATVYYANADQGGTNQLSQANPAKWPDIAGQAILPCSLTLPSFLLSINNNYNVTIPGEYLNVKTLTDGYCYCGIQEAAESSMPVLGAPFLMSQYAVFDLNGPRVGLAPQI